MEDDVGVLMVALLWLLSLCLFSLCVVGLLVLWGLRGLRRVREVGAGSMCSIMSGRAEGYRGGAPQPRTPKSKFDPLRPCDKISHK